MKTARRITDTTLLYFYKSMRPQQRLELAKQLDSIGVYEIVTRLSSRKELLTLTETLEFAKCAVYIRMDPVQLQKALRFGAKHIHLEIPASYPAIYTSYHKNKDWAKKTLLHCKEILHNADASVTLVMADASRAEPYFLELLVQMAAGMQVEKLIAKDLMGIQTLSACGELISTMVSFGYAVGYEGNDQFGLSVANTIQALRMGAVYASSCLGGLGYGCDLRRLLQTTNRVFTYEINRKGAEQLDRSFKQCFRDERMLQRQNRSAADCRFR